MRIIKLEHSVQRVEYGSEVWLKCERSDIRFVVKSKHEPGDKFNFHRWKFNLFLWFGYPDSDNFQEVFLGEFRELSMLNFREQSAIPLHALGNFIAQSAWGLSIAEVVCQFIGRVFNQSMILHLAIERNEMVVVRTWLYVEHVNPCHSKELEFMVKVPLKDLDGRIAWSNPSFAVKTV